MACPVCFLGSVLGGTIGGYFGIHPPVHTKGKLISTGITTLLVVITNVALKVFWNISLCVGGAFTLGNVLRIGIMTFILANIYSIGVNYLLGRYVFTSPVKNKQEEVQVEVKPLEKKSSCCCNPPGTIAIEVRKKPN